MTLHISSQGNVAPLAQSPWPALTSAEKETAFKSQGWKNTDEGITRESLDGIRIDLEFLTSAWVQLFASVSGSERITGPAFHFEGWDDSIARGWSFFGTVSQEK